MKKYLKIKAKMQKSNSRYNSGFTLVEMIAVVAVFSLVMTTTADLFISITRVAKSTNLARKVYQDARYALETISQEARLAKCLDVDKDANVITTTSKDDVQTKFELSGGVVTMTTLPSGAAKNLTSDAVNVLVFDVDDTEFSGGGNNVQSFFKLVIEVESKNPDIDGNRSKITLRTLISKRIYEGNVDVPVPVALWHFNEGSGQTIVNVQGDSALDGQLGSSSGVDNNDPTWTTFGRFGNALDFDNTNDYVKVSNNSKLNFGTSKDFTVEAWIKTSSASNQMIYQKGASSATQPGYRFKVYNNGKITANINNGTSETHIWSENTVIDGLWHHVAFTADRDGNAQIYIDGNPDGVPVSIASVGNIDTTADVLMGYAGGSLPFNGTIDEVWVSDIVRTSFNLNCDMI